MALFSSCCNPFEGVLFDGQDLAKWNTEGDVAVSDGVLALSGEGSGIVLKEADYTSFLLTAELRTTEGGKGALLFHTGKDLSRGYRVAINNDRNDPCWWRMSGSLEGVRNLTKSFVKEGEWYTMSVKVDGKAVTVSINGSKVVEYAEPASPFRTGKYASSLLSKGAFAIVSEGSGAIEVKNIEVAVLAQAGNEALPADAADEKSDAIIALHQEDFPVLDYHVHLKGGLTNETAAEQSRRTGINYAMAPNCGIGFPITDDAGVLNFLNEMRSEPFILAMQAEGREWVETFSAEVRDEFDFVFTDALTFTDSKGRRSRIWIAEETWIEDEEQYMDLIVERICGVLSEPMDIYVNPCFLPPQMQDRYDFFWTEERMDKFVAALAQSGKVLEINARYRIPNKAIIMKAKAAGVKFSFGTNNEKAEVGLLEYCIEMKNECGITAGDMFKPKIKI
jgi:hypothetical protein